MGQLPLALEFAVSFYDALRAGESIDFAYRLGCNAIAMAGAQGKDIPVFKQKQLNPLVQGNN